MFRGITLEGSRFRKIPTNLQLTRAQLLRFTHSEAREGIQRLLTTLSLAIMMPTDTARPFWSENCTTRYG